MSSLNLEGIRVIDYTNWVAGPLAGQILGEWGADVIHVERVDAGDVTRANGPFYKGESIYFRTYNRDKRSVTLNVTKPEGREALLQLVEQSDVFLTNFTVDFLERYNITYEELKARNPNIIACYLSGFGLTGRYKDRKGFDMTMQAMSGLMAVTGPVDGAPTKVGTIIGDYIGGYQAVIGVLLALLGRERTGKGQLVDVAITDSLIFGLDWSIPEYRLTGKTSTRMGNRRPTVAPCDLFQTKNGYLYISASSQALYVKLARLIGDPSLESDLFTDNPARVKNADALGDIIQQWVGSYDTDEVVALLDGAGVPCGPVQTPIELAQGDYVDEKGLVITVNDPVLGEIPAMGSPIKMTWGYRNNHLGAPTLGQDNVGVYKDLLHWDSDKLKSMQEKGIV